MYLLLLKWIYHYINKLEYHLMSTQKIYLGPNLDKKKDHLESI